MMEAKEVYLLAHPSVALDLAEEDLSLAHMDRLAHLVPSDQGLLVVSFLDPYLVGQVAW